MDIASLPTWVGPMTPGAVLLSAAWAFYWLVSSGRMVPRSTVDMLMQANDKVNESHEKTIASQERQIAALIDTNETTKHVLEALRDAGSEKGSHASSSS